MTLPSPSHEPFTPEVVRHLCAYSRFPERLKRMDPTLASYEKDDEFGVLERLNVIQTVFRDVDLGRLIDLGGNSGYFALSLLDSGQASSATVVDLDGGALAAGRAMAAAMHIDDRIDFVEKRIDLEYVRALPALDTVICLNLIHHAGALYDHAEVERSGWAEYARQWLVELRSKFSRAIIGVGFKGRKPVNWNVPRSSRLPMFQQMLHDTGWSTLYDANIHDIRIHGVERAKGLRHPRTELAASRPWTVPMDGLAALRNRIIGTRAEPKVAKYHIFLLQ